MNVRQIIAVRCLLMITLGASAAVFAADDDVAEPPAAAGQLRSKRGIEFVGDMAPLNNAAVLVVNGNLRATSINRIDSLVFGMDERSGRIMIESQFDRKIRELNEKYDLSADQLNKLRLAARADKVRFEHELDILRRQFADDPDRLRNVPAVLQDAGTLRGKVADLFGQGSFFDKTMKTVLKDAPLRKIPVEELSQISHRVWSSKDDGDIHDLIKRRHMANVESTVRALHRRVNLRQQQFDALIELLTKETRPAKAFGDYDDIIVRYRLAQIPENKLKPLVDNNQWPQVRQALDGFLEFGPFLIRHGLVQQDETATSESIVDATRPENRN